VDSDGKYQLPTLLRGGQKIGIYIGFSQMQLLDSVWLKPICFQFIIRPLKGTAIHKGRQFTIAVIRCYHAPKTCDNAVDWLNIAVKSCDNAPNQCVHAVGRCYHALKTCDNAVEWLNIAEKSCVNVPKQCVHAVGR